MGKFYGPIGYAENQVTSPGVTTEVITEKNHSGDVLKDNRRWQAGENLNDDLTVNNIISIIADPFASQNFFAMRYIKWMGAYWKIINVDASQRPRLILTIGGVYNGEKATTPDNA